MNEQLIGEMKRDGAEIKRQSILELVNEIAFLVSSYGLDFEYRKDSEDFRDDVQSKITEWLQELPWIAK